MSTAAICLLVIGIYIFVCPFLAVVVAKCIDERRIPRQPRPEDIEDDFREWEFEFTPGHNAWPFDQEVQR